VAVWAGNGPDWVLLEFAAGMAGLTLVTVNPAYQAEELAHVLGHSGAAGVFLRTGTQAGILAQVRDRLPLLREVLTLGDWPAGDGPLPEVDPASPAQRSEEHTSELQSLAYLVCRLLLEKKKKKLIPSSLLKKKKKKK